MRTLSSSFCPSASRTSSKSMVSMWRNSAAIGSENGPDRAISDGYLKASRALMLNPLPSSSERVRLAVSVMACSNVMRSGSAKAPLMR